MRICAKADRVFMTPTEARGAAEALDRFLIKIHSARDRCPQRPSGILQYHSQGSLFGSCPFGFKEAAGKPAAYLESDGILYCHGRGLRWQDFCHFEDNASDGHAAADGAEVVD